MKEFSSLLPNRRRLLAWAGAGWATCYAAPILIASENPTPKKSLRVSIPLYSMADVKGIVVVRDLRVRPSESISVNGLNTYGYDELLAAIRNEVPASTRCIYYLVGKVRIADESTYVGRVETWCEANDLDFILHVATGRDYPSGTTWLKLIGSRSQFLREVE